MIIRNDKRERIQEDCEKIGVPISLVVREDIPDEGAYLRKLDREDFDKWIIINKMESKLGRPQEIDDRYKKIRKYKERKKVEFCETPLKFIKSKIKWVYVGNRIKKRGNKETEKIIEEMKTKLRESGVKIVRGDKPKCKSGGMSITIHCDDKKKPTYEKRGRDIVGTNNAVYIKSWKRWSDIRANNTNLKKACYHVAYLMKDFNE